MNQSAKMSRISSAISSLVRAVPREQWRSIENACSKNRCINNVALPPVLAAAVRLVSPRDSGEVADALCVSLRTEISDGWVFDVLNGIRVTQVNQRLWHAACDSANVSREEAFLIMLQWRGKQVGV